MGPMDLLQPTTNSPLYNLLTDTRHKQCFDILMGDEYQKMAIDCGVVLLKLMKLMPVLSEFNFDDSANI